MTARAGGEMQFDRYQRLKAVADILGALDAREGPVLDVGGNPGELRAFLQTQDVVVVDRLAGAGTQFGSAHCRVRGEARWLPFKPGSFPTVVCIDTIEHLPADSRSRAIREMAEVSSGLLVIGCPTDGEETRMAEGIVDQFHRFLHGTEHPWLREHRRQGLPRRSEIERALCGLDLRFEVVPNGYLRNWLAMMLLNRWLETLPGGDTLLRGVNSIYNTSFYWRDWKFPCYRLFFVGTKAPRDLNALRKLGSTAGPEGGWDRLMAPAGVRRTGARPDVSIMIVTRRGGGMLRRCIASLEASALRPRDIVLVENGPPCVGSIGSTVDTQVLKVGAQLSFAAANNLALREARGEIVFLLNDDAYVHPDCIAEVSRVMERDANVAVVGCKIYYPGTNVLQHAGGEIFPNGRTEHIGYGEVDHGQYDIPREVDYVTGAALAVRRRMLEEAGLLDEEYYPLYFEETDLCFRVRARGYRVIYLPTAVAYHDELSAKGGLRESFFVPYHRNRLRFVVKNFDRSQLMAFLSDEVPWLWKRDYGPEKTGLRRAYLSLVGTLPRWLAARARLRLPSHVRMANDE